ncbi:diacylglycerol/lipid kinase family protein [Algisphaera agarilytica]|uniref:Diacylglycerol kinase family enzyme n=1 Tax=Algisphaera agarilytica TaxID=1385975 RepID=A0A7X0H691_9BACT|nr:diacylglycerol kinase family protein [Algisphaera agarilytica]MBB6428871.1 diacylglycerol kinase family enzyme [Algisphaera agarilytica]
MKVLILANPFSGTGPNRKRVLRLEEALTQQGLSTRVVWDRDERIPALKDAGDELRCVVAAGGDGSVADVLNDMQTAGCLGLPFATLPAGNENLFAQEFKFTGKPEDIADAIVRGDTVPVDLARAADPEQPDEPGRLFTLMTSAGFDADVVHRVDRWRNATADTSLKRVNRMSYAPRVVSAMLGYRFPPVTLEADGQTVTGHQAYVFNLPQYGGNLHIGKEAQRDDGQLAWVVFEKPGFINLLGYHWSVLRGKHLTRKTVAHGRADRVTLRTGNGHPAPAQADGDPAGDTPLEMTVMPAALNVIRV